MIFPSEQSLTSYAEQLGHSLHAPKIIELIGDVGAGKTTFAKALAKGLGVKEPVTSPSFTISNHYFYNEESAEPTSATHPNTTPVAKNHRNELIHYDFYRLTDPGLMRDDLAESLANQNAIVVLEWAESVADLLPEDHITITFQILEDGSRKLTFTGIKK